jgi:hypothetical protein
MDQVLWDNFFLQMTDSIWDRGKSNLDTNPTPHLLGTLT